jgi:major membrane immunogen (membrane-anchored lipoprotein)
MSKKVTLTEVQHQWQGKAIVRENGELKEVDLGVKQSDKKLKETGAKELFTVLPKGTITVEVVKNVDVRTVYEMSAEEFKKVAKLADVPTEEKPQK